MRREFVLRVVVLRLRLTRRWGRRLKFSLAIGRLRPATPSALCPQCNKMLRTIRSQQSALLRSGPRLRPAQAPFAGNSRRLQETVAHLTHHCPRIWICWPADVCILVPWVRQETTLVPPFVNWVRLAFLRQTGFAMYDQTENPGAGHDRQERIVPASERREPICLRRSMRASGRDQGEA